MVNPNSSISPELEQALSTVVDKRSHHNALKALELSEGAREEAETTVEQQRGHIAYLTAQKVQLEKEVEELKEIPWTGKLPKNIQIRRRQH